MRLVAREISRWRQWMVNSEGWARRARGRIFLAVALLAASGGAAFAGVSSVTPNDVAVFHFDYGGSAINNNFACQYKSYRVAFTGSPASITTTAAITSASPTITLGPGETATKVWSYPSSPLTVFYYFCSASSSPVTTNYAISATDSTSTVTYPGSLVPLNTIKAGNQAINSTSVGINSGRITLTVTGTAANLNLSAGGRILDITPNVLKSWPAGALRLEASTFKFTNQATTVSNRLSILASDVSGAGSTYSDTYTMTFTLRPVAANSGSGMIWPAAYNLSGNGLKHNDAAAYGTSNTTTLSPSQTVVSAASADFTIAGSQSAAWSSGTNGTVTYTVSNVGTVAGSGTVSVSFSSASGTISSLSGTGWTCNTTTCTRSDALAAGAAYPAITLTGQATASGANNTASTFSFIGAVSNAGDDNSANNSADLAVTVNKGSPPTASVSFHSALPSSVSRGGSLSFTVDFVNGSVRTNGNESVTGVINIPSELNTVSITATGLTCPSSSLATGATITCTRSSGAVNAGDLFGSVAISGTVSSSTASSLMSPAATVSLSGGGSASSGAVSGSVAIIALDPAVYNAVSPGVWRPGTAATLTTSVVNAGNVTISGSVHLNVAIPSELLSPQVSANASWSCGAASAGGTLSCDSTGTLAAGAAFPALTVSGTVNTTGAASLSSAASISLTGDSDTTNNSATAAAAFVGGADLTASFTPSAGALLNGAAGSIAVSVSNVGLAASSGATSVSIALPSRIAGPAVASAPGWTCATPQAGQTFSCTRSDALAAGISYAEIVITFTGAAASASSQDALFTATVTNAGDPNADNDEAAANVVIVNGANLSVTMSSARATWLYSGAAAYDIAVNYAGTTTSSSTTTLSFDVPADLTGGALVKPSGWTCGTLVAGAVLTCSTSNVLSSLQTFSITGTLAASPAATAASIQATLTNADDVNAFDNTAALTIPYVNGPDLSPAISSAAWSTTSPASVTVTIANSGSTTVTGGATTTAVISIPAALTTPTVSSAVNWSCGTPAAGADLTCARTSALAAASSFETITIQGTPSLAYGPSATVQATVANTTDVVFSNNAALLAIAITGPDMSLSVSGGAWTAGAAGSLTYTATNVGTGTTSGNIVVQIPIPSYLTSPTLSGTGWNCTSVTAGSTATCTATAAVASAGSLNALTLSGTVAVNASASTITATIAATGDSNTLNDSAAVTTTITPATTVPGAPQSASATRGDTQATVTFTAPASNGGSAVLDYTVVSSPDNRTATGSASPLTVTGLTNGTSYTFSVTARNAIGSGAAATTAAVVPAGRPSAPTIGTVTPGNGQVSVAFTASSPNGSAIINYTATCGSVSVLGLGSPITVTGLANGTAYTCQVTATNAVGTSDPSAASTSVTPTTPATSYTLTGPAGGTIGAVSANFTVTPNDVHTGTIQITRSGGGLSGAVSLTFTNSSAAQTFTITPTAVGPVTLTPSSGSALTDPVALSYATPPAPPTVGAVTAGDGSIAVAFTAPAQSGGAAITSYTATCGAQSVTGSSPITVTGLVNGTPYTCSVIATNTYGPSTASSASAPVTPTAAATTFTVTGPSGGAVGVASSPFTVTPNGPFTGTITLTPDQGLTPAVLTFTSADTAKVFTLTPVAPGLITLAATNSASLTNPANATYATSPAAPVIGTAVAQIGAIEISFTAPTENGGSAITSYTATCGARTQSGSASPLTVTGFADTTAETCRVTATNTYGTSESSAASNAVSPLAAANSYTLTGPNGGALQTASTAFTVTPGAAFAGTITITPSGGGLSTPIALTFTPSDSAKTFTITPTAAGPVTLTGTNSGSLTNPAPLTYATPPAAPTLTTVTPGLGALTLEFSAPSGNGGASLTGYTATCGSATQSGSASPLTVSGLSHTSAHSCTVTAANTYGAGEPSNAISGTPLTPAGGYSITGPSGGVLNTPSSSFTVTPNAAYSGSITVTPTGGGLSTPISLTFTPSDTAKTFTITPTAVGPVTLTATNNGSLSDPAALTYATTPEAPSLDEAVPGTRSIDVYFLPPANTGGSAITGYTADCGGGHTASGLTSPLTVTGLDPTLSYACTVIAQNTYGPSTPSGLSCPVTPLAGATQFTFTGPAGGPLGTASTAFTLTPDGPISATITITPSGGGLTAPIAVTFQPSDATQTFTITPTAPGPVTLTATNSASLSNPAPLTYATAPAAPALTGVTPGIGSLAVAFSAPAVSGGSAITGYTADCGGQTQSGAASPLLVTGLSALSAYTCAVVAHNAYGTSAPATAAGPATPYAAATLYTFSGPAGGLVNAASGVFTVTPNGAFAGTITLTPAGGGLTAPIVLTFTTADTAKTFTITPTALGEVTLTPSNSGSLANPAALAYATQPSAPVIGTVTPGNGELSVAFTPGAANGSPITGYTVTCSPGGGASGASSPILVTGLTNGTAYTCRVSATNAIGPSDLSSASAPATPVLAATSFTFNGPAGGPAGQASDLFTVTPNGAYTGAITLTPSDSNLAPIALTFAGSAAPQTFRLTPAFGPVTLTPTNSGSLSNPAALVYRTTAAAPAAPTAAPGDGSLTLTFAEPSTDGGSPITGYTAACLTAGTGSAAASPVTVSGLTNGISYTCRVTAVNAFGPGDPSESSAAASPAAPLHSYSLTGPPSGQIGATSTVFTVTPTEAFTGTITITPSGGGLSTPIPLDFASSAAPQTFRITPLSAGPVLLTPANTGTLGNPAALSYQTPPAAPVITGASPGNGAIEISFTAPPADGGAAISSYTALCGGTHSATGAASPLLVTGLTNGAAYTCTVTAANSVGSGVPSSASAPATPFAPASTYTLSGPSGGPLNTASGVFTITPDAVYSGSVTITLTGGGLAGPIVTTFSASNVAQSFTITPTATGPVTLTASNSGGLLNPSPLTYVTPPTAPGNVTATAGNGFATVSFSAPAATGGAVITQYTVECDPGSHLATGSSSPIRVDGLSNHQAYTCTVTASNSAGPGERSAPSNSVTPVAPANSFTLTGPARGPVGSASSLFTVTPNDLYDGTITITPSGGGLATPIVLTFANASTPQTFTITPLSTGPVLLTPANSGSLVNPEVRSYATPPGAPVIGAATAGNGAVTVSFTAPAATGGAAITGYLVNCGAGGSQSGLSSPITVTGLTNGLPYACTVTAANAAGPGPASPATLAVTPIAPANSFTLTGPSGGPVGAVSPSFTVTPNDLYDGDIIITPSGGGLSTPFVLHFANSRTPQQFTITPLTLGPITLTPSNNRTLANPTALVYATPPSAPTAGAVTPGDGSLSIAFLAPANTGGAPIQRYTATCDPGGHTAVGLGSPLLVTGLQNGTAYTCVLTAANAAGTSPASGPTDAATPYLPASSFTMSGPAGGPIGAPSADFIVAPNSIYSGAITIVPSGGGLSAPIVVTFDHSSQARSFRITPLGPGPITLTPAENGSLQNPPPLRYSTPPAAPVIGAAQALDGAAGISFTPPVSSGGSAIVSYLATCDPGAHTGAGTSSPLTVSGLTNGTAYTCSVSAINAFGSSAPSGPTPTVTPLGRPGPPRNVTAVAGNRQATISFTAPLSNGGAPLTGYTVTALPGGLTASGAASPITLNGLTNGTAYTFVVTASNSAGPGVPSDPTSAVLPQANLPDAPGHVSATAGDRSAQVSFSVPISGGEPITSYTVTSSPGGFSASGPASPLTVAGLTNGVAYTFTVTASTVAGTSPASAPSNSVTPAGLPSAPTGVSAAAGNAQATITFSPPADTGGLPILTYTVTSSPGGFSASGAASPLTVTGLANGTAYTFSVTAANALGTGPAAGSNAVTPANTGNGGLALKLSSTFPVGVVGIDYPLQILTATGGKAPYTFTLSAGSLPPGLNLVSPQFSGIPTSAGSYRFTITVTDADHNAASAAGSILINPADADLILSESTAAFALAVGAEGLPTPASVTVRSSVIEQLLRFAVTTTPPVSWLTVESGSLTPGSLRIALSPDSLSLPPTDDGYHTTVQVACIAPSPCAGKVKTIEVSLQVSAPAPRLTLTGDLLTFEALLTDPQVRTGSVGVQNAGGGSLDIQAVTAGAPWISVSGAPARLAAGPPVPLSISVDPAGLPEGYHTSAITITSSAGSLSMPVALRVTGQATLLLSPAGAQITAPVGGVPGQPVGSFAVSANTETAIPWSAEVVSGAPWLSVLTTGGAAASTAPGTVSYRVDPAALPSPAAGALYGAIRITAEGAVNAPLDFGVILNLLPAGTQVKPEPSPAGLVFTSGGPSSQPVQVFAGSAAALPYQASAAAADGGSWLSVTPPTGAASAAAPAASSISVNPAGLAPGVYRGGVSYAFSSAAVRTVNVTLIVTGPATSLSAPSLSTAGSPGAACTPAALIPTQVGLVHNFQQPAGWPAPLAIRILNDCGQPVTDGQVTVSFSNGDPPMTLTRTDRVSGIFAGTWTPRGVSPQVTVLTRAVAAGLPAATASITGQVTANHPPLLAENGVLHIFRPLLGGALAPGAAIQIYGSGLAEDSFLADAGVLPAALGGTSVLIGGRPAPLYAASPGQINAQVPYELAPGKRYQVQVNVHGALSTPATLELVPAAPGIAASPAGEALAQHADYRLISSSAPARPGETVILYLAGLGALDAPLATGAPAPASPPLHPAAPVTLTLNGQPVSIDFAGLTPGAVGLYQINFRVPAAAPGGPATLVLTQAGQSSNAVTLAIEP